MLPGGVSSYEMILVGIVAIVLFGKNLPDVARKAGKSFAEFKRGMMGLQREFNSAMNESTSTASTYQSSRPAPSRRPEPLEDRLLQLQPGTRHLHFPRLR